MRPILLSILLGVTFANAAFDLWRIEHWGRNWLTARAFCSLGVLCVTIIAVAFWKYGS